MRLLDKLGANRVRELTALFPIRTGARDAAGVSPHTELLRAFEALDHKRLDAVTSLHGARWFISCRLEQSATESDVPYLVFLTAFDGEIDTHLEELACVLKPEMEAIFGCCVGSELRITPAGFRDYVKRHRTKSAFFLRDQEEASALFVRNSLKVKRKLRELIASSQDLPLDEAFKGLEAFAREVGIWHPVRPHALETVANGELREIRATIDLARRRLLKDYYATRANPAQESIARRGAHAKQHGCVRATFEVTDGIPEEYRVGLAATPRTYDATIRFSNGAEEIQSDKRGDGRGLAIQIEGVEGDRFGEHVSGKSDTHDFLLVSSENFFCADVRTYRIFRALRDLRGLAGMLLPGIFLLARPRQAINLFRILFGRQIHDLLDGTYHSMTCHLWGDARAARIVARPVDPKTLELLEPQKKAHLQGPPARLGTDEKKEWKENHLRHRLVARLDPSRGKDAAFELAIQPRAEGVDSIEDPTRSWKSKQRIRIGIIRIKRQVFDTPDGRDACEAIVFSPWNVLKEHRPLGGISRVRLGTYLVSSTLRRQLNRRHGGRGS